MKKRIYIPLLLILVATAGFFVWHSKTQTTTNNKTSPKKSVKPLPKEITIKLDKNGFSPAVVTIKTGSAVRWKNESGDKQTVNSDDYPTNQKHRELNFGIFNDGSSVVYTFTRLGEYGYHNQLKPDQKGKVIVEK